MNQALTFLFAFAVFLSCASITVVGQIPTYPNTVAGLQQQFADVMEAERKNDAARVEQLIKDMILADPDKWAAAKLPKHNRSDVLTKYRSMVPIFQARVLAEATRLRDTDEPTVAVVPYSIPAGISTKERSAIVDYGASPYQVAFSATAVEPQTIIESFLFQDGAFRFVGYGIFPFWADRPSGLTVDGKIVTARRLLSHVDPIYTEEARKRGIEGNVVVNLVVGIDGRGHDLKVTNGDPMLVQSALAAVEQWRFKPAEMDGKPVEVHINVSVSFKLYK